MEKAEGKVPYHVFFAFSYPNICATIAPGTGFQPVFLFVIYKMCIRDRLYPVIGETVHISPDFEEARLEGDFDIRGRVRIAVVLDVVLRIILDKKTWRFIRQLKKEEMTNGR